MTRLNTNSVLFRYFAGIAEQTFQGQLGVTDPSLIDYLSLLLFRFVRTEAVNKMRNLTGHRLLGVAEMLVEAKARQGTARRAAYRHIGDFTMFWAGVYPEALRALQAADKKDHFIDYCQQGKRAYWIASQIPGDEEDASAEVLAQVSEDFALCAYGLREVRREWEQPTEAKQLLM